MLLTFANKENNKKKRGRGPGHSVISWINTIGFQKGKIMRHWNTFRSICLIRLVPALINYSTHKRYWNIALYIPLVLKMRMSIWWLWRFFKKSAQSIADEDYNVQIQEFIKCALNHYDNNMQIKSPITPATHRRIESF